MADAANSEFFCPHCGIALDLDEFVKDYFAGNGARFNCGGCSGLCQILTLSAPDMAFTWLDLLALKG